MQTNIAKNLDEGYFSVLSVGNSNAGGVFVCCIGDFAFTAIAKKNIFSWWRCKVFKQFRKKAVRLSAV